MSLLTDEEVKEIRLSMPAVCHHADLIRHTETFIESKLSSLRAEIEALKQQVEQGKRDAVPEGWVLVPKEPTEAMLGAISWELVNYCRKEQIYRAAIAAAPKQEK